MEPLEHIDLLKRQRTGFIILLTVFLIYILTA